MGRCCAAVGCTSNSKRDKSVSYHLFPRNAARRAQWIAKLNRDKLPTKLTLCSLHFEKDAYDPSAELARRLMGIGRVRLKPDAVPTIFSQTPSPGARTKFFKTDPVKENIVNAMNDSCDKLTTDKTIPAITGKRVTRSITAKPNLVTSISIQDSTPKILTLDSLTSGEKAIVLNVFDNTSEEFDTSPLLKVVRLTANATGVSAYNVLRTCDERDETEALTDCESILTDSVCALLRKLLLGSKSCTIENVLEAVDGDPQLQNLDRSSFLRVLRKIEIQFLKTKMNKICSDLRSKQQENIGENIVIKHNMLKWKIFCEMGLKLTRKDFTDFMQNAIDENVIAKLNGIEVEGTSEEALSTTLSTLNVITRGSSTGTVTCMSSTMTDQQAMPLTNGEKVIALNVFDSLSAEFQTLPLSQVVRLTAETTGLPSCSVHKVFKERAETSGTDKFGVWSKSGRLKRPLSKGDVNYKMRKLTRGKNKSLMVKKLLEMVNCDPQLPSFGQVEFVGVLRKMGYKFSQKKRFIKVCSDIQKEQQEKLDEKEVTENSGVIGFLPLQETNDSTQSNSVDCNVIDTEQINITKHDIEQHLNLDSFEMQSLVKSEDMLQQCENESMHSELSETKSCEMNYKSILLNELQNIVQYMSNDPVNVSFRTVPDEPREKVWAINGPKKNLIIKLEFQNDCIDEFVSIKQEADEDLKVDDEAIMVPVTGTLVDETVQNSQTNIRSLSSETFALQSTIYH